MSTHNCLVQSSDPIWHFGKGKLVAKFKVPRTFSSNSFMVLQTAALKGLGIAFLPYRIEREDLKSGKLIELLKDQAVVERPLYAAFAPGAPLPEKVSQAPAVSSVGMSRLAQSLFGTGAGAAPRNLAGFASGAARSQIRIMTDYGMSCANLPAGFALPCFGDLQRGARAANWA